MVPTLVNGRHLPWGFFRAVFIPWHSDSRAWERPKTESRVIPYLLALGPCPQKVNLNAQQLKQRWVKGMGMGLRSICYIKQIYVKTKYSTDVVCQYLTFSPSV